MNTKMTQAAGLLACAVWLGDTIPANAQDTATWTGIGADGLYSNGANWDLGGLDVPINGGTIYLTVIPAGEDVTFDIVGPSEIDGLDLGLGSVFSLAAGRALDVLGAGEIQGFVTADGAGTSFSCGTGSTLDGGRFEATNGAQISSAATALTYPGGATGTGVIFSADGAGSLIDVSDLLTYDDDRNYSGVGVRAIRASNGGTVDLSSLLSLVGASSNDTLSIELLAGGTLDLGSLESLTQQTSLTATSGETLSLPALTSADHAFLNIAAGATLDAPLLTDWTSSLLEFDPSFTVNTAPLTNVDGSRFFVSGGLSYSDVAATSYEYVGFALANSGVVQSADGAGSLLDLSSLLSYIDGRNHSGAATRTLTATNGGVVDMSNVEVIEGGASNDLLSLAFTNSGTLDLSDWKTSTGRTEVALEAGLSQSLPLESMDQGSFDIPASSNLTLNSLTEFTSSDLFLNPSTNLTTAPLSNINGTRVEISGGLNYTDIVATNYSYEGTALTNSGPVFKADGAGSRLDLTSIENYVDDRNLSGTGIRTVTATNGGEVDLSNLETVSGGNSNDILSFDFNTTGTLHLQDLTASTGRTRISLEPGVSLNLPNLVTMDEGMLDVPSGADLTANQLSEFTSGEILRDPSLSIITAPITNLNGTRVAISGGLEYTDIIATEYSYVGANLPTATAVFSVDGSGSKLDLSSLVSLVDNRDLSGSPTRTVSATNGGTLDLSNLTSVVGANSNDILSFNFVPGSSLMLDNLTTTTGRTRFSLEAGANITLPALTSVDEGIFDLAVGSSLDASLLTEITSSGLLLDPSVNLTTGSISNMDGSRITISGGLNYTDIAASSYSYTGTGLPSSGNILVADGPGSVLDLSSLRSFIDDRNLSGSPVRTLLATNSGTLDLSNLRNCEGGVTNDVLEFKSDLGGSILLRQMGGIARLGGLSGFVQFSVTDASSIIEIANLELAASNPIVVENEGTLSVMEGFVFSSTDESNVNFDTGRIIFADGSYPGRTVLEMGGADLGLGGPTSGNFGVGELAVGSATETVTLNLVDWEDNGNRGGGAEALYLFGIGGGDGLQVENGSTVIIPTDSNVYALLGGVETHLNALFPAEVTTIAFDGGFLQLGDETTDVKEDQFVSLQFAVSPNPVRDHATLQFGLAESGPAKIELFDVRGRLVRTLVDSAALGAGQHTVDWNGTDDRGVRVASGVYFAHFHTSSFQRVKRMTLLP